MKIDHVVILVQDLAQAMGDYAACGYTVTPGGEHIAGETHNALVCLADGAYLELIAFKVPFSKTHRWQRYRAFPGVIDYCLCYESVEVAIQAANIMAGANALTALNYVGVQDCPPPQPKGCHL